MYHYVAVDGIGPGITTVGGAIATADAATLFQDIVPLNAYRCILLLQEVLADLGIPNKLVGIHAGIIITATALLRDIATKLKIPRCIDNNITSVVEAPCITVAVLLHLITCMLVVHTSVHTNFYQIGTIVQAQTLANAGATCSGFL